MICYLLMNDFIVVFFFIFRNKISLFVLKFFLMKLIRFNKYKLWIIKVNKKDLISFFIMLFMKLKYYLKNNVISLIIMIFLEKNVFFLVYLK